MSFIHNNSYNSLKKSGRSNAASVSGAQNKKVSEPRLFSVAINSLGTDADEAITGGFTLTYQERMLQALPQKNSLAAAQTPITDTRIYTTDTRIYTTDT